MGQAIGRYRMIEDGDRIVVGMSGGKDSQTLLWMLAERIKRVPIDYRLFPVYVDPGFEPSFAGHLKRYLNSMGHRLVVEKTNYGPVAHSELNRENPCFLCSRRRRQRLFEIADELKCRKIALGHNQDDIIETLLINLCYSGEISTMLPMQSFFKGAMTIIRPLAHTAETDIRRFIDHHQIPVFKNACPSAGHSKRETIKTLLKDLYRQNKKIRGNIFRAMHHVNPDYLPPSTALKGNKDKK